MAAPSQTSREGGGELRRGKTQTPIGYNPFVCFDSCGAPSAYCAHFSALMTTYSCRWHARWLVPAVREAQLGD